MGSHPHGPPRRPRLVATVLLALAMAVVGGAPRAGWPTVVAATGNQVPGPSSGNDARVSVSTLDPGAFARSSAGTPASFALDLYRPGVFATQATWWYCTAASVQIMRNIDRGQADHSPASQTRYFTYMRQRNAHRMPVADGIDPPGFLAGLRAYVDPGYRLVASTTFDNAVRSAVRRLRTSRLPVALIVDHGRHAWVLTGFSSTADPALGPGFRVLTVRIVGPLYGRQSLNGYDPPPDTRMSVDALRRYLTPYAFKYGATPWDGRFVTLQSVA